MKGKCFILGVCFLVASYVSMYGQDTVRYLDPHYLFKENYDSPLYGVSAYAIGNLNIQDFDTISEETGSFLACKYATEKASVVYGVALLAVALPLEECAPVIALEKYSINPSRDLETVEEFHQGGLMKRRVFEFEPITMNFTWAPCGVLANSYEFYFDSPLPVDGLPDSIFATAFFPAEYSPCYSSHLAGYCHGLESDSGYYVPLGDTYPHPTDPYDVFYSSFLRDILGVGEYRFDHKLGPLFPIVKLRCSAPKLRLFARGDGTVTVKWRQNEYPEAYQLAIGYPERPPELNTLVTPENDSVHTFEGLIDGQRYSVWVRKACRYTTTQYDTLVWGEWSEPLTFFATAYTGIEGVEADGVKIYSRPGTIVVESGEGLPEVRVYDMLGREVATAPATEATRQVLTVPTAGVYVVRAGERSHRRVVVLR